LKGLTEKAEENNVEKKLGKYRKGKYRKQTLL
jgi:hypothetical protein